MSLVHCLILCPSGTWKGTFRRWGMIVVNLKRNYGVPTFEGALQWDKIENEDWFEFEENHGDGRYTITII